MIRQCVMHDNQHSLGAYTTSTPNNSFRRGKATNIQRSANHDTSYGNNKHVSLTKRSLEEIALIKAEILVMGPKTFLTGTIRTTMTASLNETRHAMINPMLPKQLYPVALSRKQHITYEPSVTVIISQLLDSKPCSKNTTNLYQII